MKPGERIKVSRDYDVDMTEAALEQERQGRWAREVLFSRQRRDSLKAQHANVLELLATERPLPEVLQALVLSIEREVEGMLASVLLLDAERKHLCHGAAPSLPYTYVRAIDGLAIGPRVGSCGTAAFTERCIVVEDIATDPLWERFRDLALSHGLRACWSLPIVSSDGRVLGTFAMYYTLRRAPTALERELADAAARIAALAIEQRESQRALRESEERLEQIVEERTRELLLAKDAAEQARAKLSRYAQQLEERNRALVQARAKSSLARRARSRFLASMSHEIRLPMTSILGYADLLTRDPSICGSSPECSRAVETIGHNARHLLSIVSDVLELAQLEAGKARIEMERCSPAEIALDGVDLLRPRAEGEGLSLVVNFEGEIPETIRSDRAALRRVLLHVLANAIEFTPAGAVRLSVSLMRRRGDAPQLRFQVSNSSCDLDEEQMHRLFEPFALANAGRVQKFGITGLGLTISRWTAQLLGGDMSICAGPESGSTLEFTVDTGTLQGVRMLSPEECVRSALPTGPTMPAEHDLDGLRVLVADDTPDNQRLIAYMLRREHAEVTVVGDGRAAVDRALAAQQAGTPFDAVLMDLQMPELDGLAATRELRAHGFANPIIAVSAHVMPEDRERCLEAGMDDHVCKPIEPDALTAALRRHVLASAAPLDVAAALERMGGSVPLLLELLDLYLVRDRDALADLREAVGRGDMHEAGRIVHAVRSSVSNFSAGPAIRAAERMELIARSGPTAEAEPAIAALEREMQRLRQALEGLRRSMTASTDTVHVAATTR